ncbi:hypothetical protein ACHAW5_006211 [Stephanodiscus triporus]|uniref:Uncharacterized protein n=1 Tax=Stephanodiscus triporus TaxID=2934178 RepID=A0ABD3MYX8_9STRA
MEEISRRNTDVEIDNISDDISALSMDGASAIAGRDMTKRLRNNFAKMQLGIPEDDEEQASAVVVGDLIEPFPRTEEKNEKKNERKHRHKSKKHRKKGSKSDSFLSREESQGSTKRRDKKSEKKQKQKQQDVENIIGEKASPAPPIMEISIESSESGPRFPALPSECHSRSQENACDASVPSTGSTSNSRSASVRQASSFTGGGAMGMAIKRSRLQLGSSLRSLDNRSSMCDNESMTQMTEHSTHTTGQSSIANQSHATTEETKQLRVLLEHARMEGRQVLDIYKRLEKEVQAAMTRKEKAKHDRQNLAIEIQELSVEHEQLKRELQYLHSDNDKLRSKFRHSREREEDRDLDDVLDSMEAKIKALKFKRTKDRRASPKS